MYRNDDGLNTSQIRMNLPQMGNSNNNTNNSYSTDMSHLNARPAVVGPFGNHYGIDSTAGSIAGTNIGIGPLGVESDNKSISSTPSKISKFTYSGKPYF